MVDPVLLEHALQKLVSKRIQDHLVVGDLAAAEDPRRHWIDNVDRKTKTYLVSHGVMGT